MGEPESAGYNRDWVLLPDPISVSLREAPDAVVAELPDVPAIFLLWPERGAPYLARTSVLRRRVARLLRPGGQNSRLLNLRDVSVRLQYWPVRSNLGGLLLQFAVARQVFPDSYQKLLKLRWPCYVKLVENNPFPRLQVTSRLSGAGTYYGPFASRAAAEQFEAACLDQFLIRRCQENLEPSREHPGCVYGEMNRCLRPCQLAVGEAEYAAEVAKVKEYLATNGTSLLASLEQERDQASSDLDFELAAKLHQRLERARLALPGAGELPRLIDRLHGLCVMPASGAALVEIWPVYSGCWQEPILFSTEYAGPQARSLDARLREEFEHKPMTAIPLIDRAEGLALLTRWFHSSWREGEWLAVEEWNRIPYRKLVNAVGRVGRAVATPSSAAGV